MTDKGDIVSYTPGVNEPMRYTGEGLTAIVTRIWDSGMVTLVVFDEDGIVHPRRNIQILKHGDELPAFGPYAVGKKPPGKPEPPEPVPPVLTALKPTSTFIGSDDIPLECQGSNFTLDSIITFAGSDEVTVYKNAGKLTTILEPTTTTIPAAYPVTVKNSIGESAPLMFTFKELTT